MKALDEEIKNLRSEILEMHEIARKSVSTCFVAMKGNGDVVKDISKIEELSD
ncbi:MAG: hypothetical protein QXR27_00340 [Archaeoglobaceae archaeon]